jgi:hypothetical protein
MSTFCYRLSGFSMAAAMLAGCGGSQSAIIPSAGSDSGITRSTLPTLTLSGETLSSTKVHRGCQWVASSIESWTVKFRAAGAADGPLPGTFTARGYVNRTVQHSVTHYSFRETFDIASGSKHVSGTATGGQNFSLTCDHSSPNQSGFSVTAASYKARHGQIRGTTTSALSGLGGSSFSESFQ